MYIANQYNFPAAVSSPTFPFEGEGPGVLDRRGVRFSGRIDVGARCCFLAVNATLGNVQNVK